MSMRWCPTTPPIRGRSGRAAVNAAPLAPEVNEDNAKPG
ncbi:hypothetical protein ABIA33_005932 [Streptacidiphilus sp. MAP12-16]